MTTSERELERLIAKIRVADSGCWIWQGHIRPTGYGSFNRKSDGTWRSQQAHRAAYEMLRGPIPDGLTLDHLCSVRACVNPEHLDPCTLGENSRRAATWSGNRTHCPKGHPYEGDNLIIGRPSDKPNQRRCFTCEREKGAIYRARIRAERGTGQLIERDGRLVNARVSEAALAREVRKRARREAQD
jgi:hypothetical protein